MRMGQNIIIKVFPFLLIQVCKCDLIFLIPRMRLSLVLSDGIWNAAPASLLKFNTYLSLKCELNSVVEQWAGTSLPPSLVAVKAFQQSAGKTTHIPGEPEKETIKRMVITSQLSIICYHKWAGSWMSPSICLSHRFIFIITHMWRLFFILQCQHQCKSRACHMMDHCWLLDRQFYLKCILSNPLLFDLACNPCPRSQHNPGL